MATQPASGYSSVTFEIRSKLPKQHIPAYRVENRNMVDPTDAAHLVDGEFVALINRATLRKLTADYLPGGASEVDPTVYWQVHGKPGRGDLQYGMYPVIMDIDYEFEFACLDSGGLAGYQNGVHCKVGLVDTPKAGTAGLIPASSGDYYHAVCQGPVNALGYAPFFRKEGYLP